MSDNGPLEVLSCPQCAGAVKPDDIFCGGCGAPLTGEAQARRDRLRSLKQQRSASLKRARRRATSARKATIGNARQVMLVVSVLQVLYSIFLWWALGQFVGEARRHPELDPQAVAEVAAQFKLVVAASAMVGLLFFAFWWWAATNPFAATLSALVLYGTLLLVGMIVAPLTILQGIIIKVIIVLMLLRGVQAGLAQSRASAPRGTGRATARQGTGRMRGRPTRG